MASNDQNLLEEMVDFQSLFQGLKEKVLKSPAVREDDDLVSQFDHVNTRLSSLMKTTIQHCFSTSREASADRKGARKSSSATLLSPAARDAAHGARNLIFTGEIIEHE